MKIFIFEVYKWDYCGGAIAVIADSYDNAVRLVNKHFEDDHKRDGWSFAFTPHTFYKEDTGDEGTDQWILKGEFELKNSSEEARVVAESYNYA